MIHRYAVYPALFAAIVLCTTASASITGTVTDTTGSPVSGALVTFTGESSPDNVYSGYTDIDGTYELALSPLRVNEETPSGFQLDQNFPNPFNPSTTISFSLDKAGFVNLSVYTISGQKVSKLIDNFVSSGSHTITWHGIGDDGKRLAAGIYLYQFKSGDHIESRKMLMIDGGNVNSIPIRDNYVSSDRSILAKPTTEVENALYNVRITGDDIAIYEKSGVNAHEGETLDFAVKRLSGGLMFVTIPGGTFMMGEDDTSDGKFAPSFEATVSGFEIGRTEITNLQYAIYLNELQANDYFYVNLYGEVYRKTDDWTGEKYLRSGAKTDSFNECWIDYNDTTNVFLVTPGRENLPVVAVTWHGAKAFALHYGFDLPAEKEWEYAARGGKQYKYASDDNTIRSKFNFFGTPGDEYPVEIGSYPPNPFGLYDMSGNVSEWCNDKYIWDYPEDVDPSDFPPVFTTMVYRGGSYRDTADKCRTSFAGGNERPENSFTTLGFRVVRRP